MKRMDGMKGKVTGFMFAIIVTVIVLAALMAAYVIVSLYYTNYLKQNINSEVKICETFEKGVLFGTQRCPE
jgi:hypothetical protein